MQINLQQARRFLLRHQGLLGEYAYAGPAGIEDFVSLAGCIQFDPIDVCGRNPELVLQSRLRNYAPVQLQGLLYEKRSLIDYFDKQLAIFLTRDWPYFARTRSLYCSSSRGRQDVDAIAPFIKALIRERGPVCARDVDLDQKVHWYWGPTRLARAALETLYFRGELVVHSKQGSIKYYALAADHLPETIVRAPEPLPSDRDHYRWRVRRRIAALGLLWNRGSDAWLGIKGLSAAARERAFADLLGAGEILSCRVNGIKDDFYMVKEAEPLMQAICDGAEFPGRTEFIAPLDSFMWDRKLIRALFDFDYTWEVYVPAGRRKYGYYVLPVLQGEGFIGRIEIVRDRNAACLVVRNFWPQPTFRADDDAWFAMADALSRFGRVHGLPVDAGPLLTFVGKYGLL